MKRPNVLMIVTDQFRYDCISALGNKTIKTPNIDRLVNRGITFLNGYSTCPVCIPARYTYMTGREPYNTGCYMNEVPAPMDGLAKNMEERCGKFLPRTMSNLGYRTFGIGKFHTIPDAFEELGFDVHLHTEEIMETKEQRKKDAFHKFISQEHPEFNYIEQLHGERTDMYYMPQTSSLPADYTVEAFVANKTIEQLNVVDERPFFGIVSFIGPHPPFAPPIPYNRMYNPDLMSNPISGDIEIDHMDEQIPFMNRLIWADEINDFLARSLKARYYGEITYIDSCIGKILDTVEQLPNSENTIICFFSDHGDHLGDHHAWQKESYFDVSCRIPFLVSWPAVIKQNEKREELVCLSDLFGLATTAAGKQEFRDGIDVLGVLNNTSNPRDYLYACYGRPGTKMFKVMLLTDEYKYIFISNGNREQLFDRKNDPYELNSVLNSQKETAKKLRKIAFEHSIRRGLYNALEENDFKAFIFEKLPRKRIRQFDLSSGVNDFLQN